MRVWHYTTFWALKKIFEDGELKPSPSYVEGEPALLWFSTNPDWEETVRKALMDPKTNKQTEPLSRDGLSKAGIPPVRFVFDGIDEHLVHWIYVKENLMPQALAEGLEKMAKEWGADPNEWYAAEEPILLLKAIYPAVEVWTGQAWENFKNVEFFNRGGD